MDGGGKGDIVMVSPPSLSRYYPGGKKCRAGTGEPPIISRGICDSKAAARWLDQRGKSHPRDPYLYQRPAPTLSLPILPRMRRNC